MYYRKYRPQKFNEIVGQEIIVKILKNFLKNLEFRILHFVGRHAIILVGGGAKCHRNASKKCSKLLLD